MTIYNAESIYIPEDYIKTYTTETEMRKFLKDSGIDWENATIWEIPPTHFGLKPTLMVFFENREVMIAVKGT